MNTIISTKVFSGVNDKISLEHDASHSTMASYWPCTFYNLISEYVTGASSQSLLESLLSGNDGKSKSA